jgi:two-component system sensor histidine kinase DctS
MKRWLWLLPGALALVFVVLIAVWAEANDAAERASYQQVLVTDATSVDVQLSARQDMEKARLRELATRLPDPGGSLDAALAAMPEVVAGLDRLWNRLVWLDADHRVVARATRLSPIESSATEALRVQARGQADHLVAPIAGANGSGGQLLARYEVTDLLKSTDLGWLTRRYEVNFISELGEVIATTASAAKVAHGVRFERPLAAFKDTTLWLTPYESLASWKQSARTLALLGGLLLLGAAASELLRREMGRVSRAVTASQTEAAWRQSIEDSALVGLRARDPGGRILYVNRTLCQMVGYSRDELVGLLPPLPFWPPEAVDAMMARNANTLAGDAPVEGVETRWRHRDGHLLDVVVFESRLVDANGRQIGWMGSIVDISERKRLEEKDRQHIETLSQHVRLNDMGLLASELAHELNQPLGSIISYSAGLGMALKKRLPEEPELLAAMDAVRQHARKAGDIVKWIGVKSSRVEPVRTDNGINAIVASALQVRSRQITRARVTLLTALAPDLPEVPSARIGIEQVVNNLVRNAADALAEQMGERRIRVATELLCERGCPDRVQVTVSDNGPGLQGRSIDVLCSTFYSTKRQGMGLGLGICRSIVESHDGKLTADEAPGGGARFCFTLGLAPARALASAI